MAWPMPRSRARSERPLTSARVGRTAMYSKNDRTPPGAKGAVSAGQYPFHVGHGEVVQRKPRDDHVVGLAGREVFHGTVQHAGGAGYRLKCRLEANRCSSCSTNVWLSSTRSMRSPGRMTAEIRRVTAPVPGPTSRIRREIVSSPILDEAGQGGGQNRPLGKTAPVVWKFRKNSRKNRACSVRPRRWCRFYRAVSVDAT